MLGGISFYLFLHRQRFLKTKCYFRTTLTPFVVFMFVAYLILKMGSNRCVFVIFSLQAIRIAQRLMRIQRKGKCHIIVIGKLN